jgi:hypothetical protein
LGFGATLTETKILIVLLLLRARELANGAVFPTPAKSSASSAWNPNPEPPILSLVLHSNPATPRGILRKVFNFEQTGALWRLIVIMGVPEESRFEVSLIVSLSPRRTENRLLLHSFSSSSPGHFGRRIRRREKRVTSCFRT